MGVYFTSVARVRDWQAFRRVGTEALGRARAVGATRYRVYRNLHDASQALVVAEFADCGAGDEFAREFAAALSLQGVDDVSDDRVWEATDLAGIG